MSEIGNRRLVMSCCRAKTVWARCLASVGRSLTLELRVGAKIGVELISPDGKIQQRYPEAFLPAGAHRFEMPSNRGVGILRTVVNGHAKSELVSFSR